MTQGCKNCAYAQWIRTPSGRIKSSVAGRCTYEIPLPLMPSCVLEYRPPHRIAIWPDYGQNCATWKPIDHEPDRTPSSSPPP